MTVLPKSIGRDEPLHLLIDSTGLKIYGEGEWLDQKRGIRSPRRWRKLHLGVDADTHEVVAVELTQDDVGDVAELVGLLDQVATQVASVIADGAYDGETVYDAVANRHPEADIIIPPRATAVPSTEWGDAARSAYCNHRKAWSHRLAASFWLQLAKPR